MLFQPNPPSITDYISAGAASLSLIISIIAIVISIRASKSTMKMAKRQTAFDLHEQWKEVHDINTSALVPAHVITAGNVLGLTAQCWNEDIVEKVILFQSYWEPYKSLFDKMEGSDIPVIGTGKTLKQFITSEMRRAYDEMHEREISGVPHSRISG